jgi:hypothetical protein
MLVGVKTNALSVGSLALALLVTNGCKKDAPASDGTSSAAASAAAATPATPLAALGDFEGEIGLLVKSKSESKPIPPLTMLVKTGRIRFDVPAGLEAAGRVGGQGYVVIDGPNKKMMTVLTEQKQVVEFDLARAAEQWKGMRPTPGAPPSPQQAGTPPKITRTGRTETVAGKSCEDWDITGANGDRAQVCVANEGASWLELPTLTLPPDQAWAKELLDGHHLPLRFIGYAKDGSEDTRVEVTRLEKKSIPDDTFAVPPGYRVMDLAAMFAGMGMPPGAMGQPGTTPSGMPPGMPAGMPPGMSEQVLKAMREHMRARANAVK